MVEVRDRRLHLRARQRLDHFPASIGRAYDNDVIVDDRYVDPHHAVLTLDDDGVVVIEDLGSVNGVWDRARGQRSARLRLASGGGARLGETVLRVLDVGHTVPRAVPQPAEGRLVGLLASPRAAWLAVAGALVLSLVLAWLRQYEGEHASTLVNAGSYLFLGLCLWAGLWALIGRAQARRARFLTHLAIASLALAIATLWGTAANVVEFLWPETPVRPVLESAGSLVVVAAALGAHLSLVSTLSRRRRMLAAAAAALLLLGLVKLGDWSSEDEFDNALHYSSVLQPFGAGLAHTVTLDRFLDDAGELRADLDSLAARRNRATAATLLESHSGTAP